MRKSIINKIKNRSLLFNCLVLLVIPSINISAQKISKTFTKEVIVTDGTTIISESPRKLNYAMNGIIHVTNNNNNYVITPGKNDGVPALVISDYNIETWDENKLIHTVEITITPDKRYPDDAKRLLDALNQEIKQKTNNTLVLDDNLNINQFGFENSFFSKNKNTITLENNSTYFVKGIEIKASVKIPNNCKFEYSAEYLNLNVDDFGGELTLNLKSGDLNAGNIKSLKGNFSFSKVKFINADYVELNTDKVKLKAGCIGNMIVSSEQLARNRVYKGCLLRDVQNSQLSEYIIDSVDELIINETNNDNFILGTVGKLKSIYSTFTNYDIEKLNNELIVSMKSGDLTVKQIAEDFKTIDIDNQTSSIDLGIKYLENYNLQLHDNSSIEFNFWGDLKEQYLKENTKNNYTKGSGENSGIINLRCRDCKVQAI